MGRARSPSELRWSGDSIGFADGVFASLECCRLWLLGTGIHPCLLATYWTLSGKRVNTDFSGYHRIADEKIAATWVT